VTLKRRPRNAMEASEIAMAINLVAALETRRRLEDGPYGGMPIPVGDEVVGEALDCPLEEGGQWHVAGIADLALAQTAHELSKGRLWLSGQYSDAVKDIPMASLGKVAKLGFLHRDINGSGNRGAFDISKPCSTNPTYPTLWWHDADKERNMIVVPDSEGKVRIGREERAAEIWATRSHAHHNADLRFNSQALAVAYTEQPTLGGRSWPNLVFKNINEEIKFTLWGNSTLGFLCYWWHSTKEDAGRGIMPRLQAATMATLDSSKLSEKQIRAAIAIFGDMKQREMLPFNEADHDPVRQELDRRLVTEVLGLDAGILGPLDLLRQKFVRRAVGTRGENT
jgi:hypothetical protein